MADVVNIAGLGDAIADAVRAYTEDVIDGIEPLVDSTAKDTLSDLRAASPVQGIASGGAYRKGWRISKVYSRNGFQGRVLHNKTDYQLAHLLEFGHALRNGGRASAIPHIAPVAEAHLPRFAKDLGRLVQTGGGA